jgi:hypothetical protein
MAERVTKIYADQLADAALGNGLKKNVSDDTKFDLALKTNGGLDFDLTELIVDVTDIIDDMAGLTESGNKIQVSLDDTYLEFSSASGEEGKITIKVDSITEDRLDIYNSPSDGYYLQYDSINGLQWVDLDADFISDDDIIVNEIPTGTIGSGNVTFTLANTPLVGKVQIFLNGLLQAPGALKDYTITGVTITFNKAPHAGSEIYATYFIS